MDELPYNDVVSLHYLVDELEKPHPQESQEPTASKDNLKKSSFLTDEKLRSIMTYLDEVETAERLTDIDQVRVWPKTVKKYTNSTTNKSQTQHARAYKVTSFLSTYCELSTNPCSKFLYGLGP